MTTLKLDKIYKKYPNATHYSVEDFSIDIKDKEFIVFVGPSGCGKSTTLRMIAGLEDITEGECSIDGTVVNNVAPKDRDIAMVFQNYALYPHMTVYDNMAFGLKLRKYSKEDIDKRVQEAAEILGLKEFLDRKPADLSGGQRQRVAMGRAIVRDAKVFLMDEPLSNLDAKLRVSMRAEIAKIHRRIGATTICVTHAQTEAMTLADRIVIMSATKNPAGTGTIGRVEQIGTPQEVYKNPVNKFVAGFIGSPAMNFINVKLEGGHIVANGLNLKVPEGALKVLKEKGYEPPIHDFSMISLGTGEDITDSVLTDKGYTFLLVAHRIEEADDSNIDLINEIYDYSVEHGYGFYALTSSPDEEIEMWRERTGAEYPFCQMDDITLKTIIRSNPGLLLIKDGTILNKWSDNQLPDEYVLNDSLDKLELGQQKQENKLHTIGYVLLWFIVPLTLVVGIDILIIKRRERKSRERQAAQFSDNQENDKL